MFTSASVAAVGVAAATTAAAIAAAFATKQAKEKKIVEAGTEIIIINKRDTTCKSYFFATP
jgi:hypothetical protein